ncbi:MAG: mechanosensitive ion channel family protein [Vicinamibacterales bacterium]
MTSFLALTIAAVVLTFVAATALVRLAHVAINRLLATLEIVGAENQAVVQGRARQLKSALALLAYAVAAIASVSLALERFGVAEPQWSPRQLLHWLFTHGVNTLLILIVAFIVVRGAHLVVEHLQVKAGRRFAATDLEWQRRATTLGRILTSLVTAAVGFTAVLMILRELAVDILPILTGAGIAGLAIGFGAQHLVRDVIAGFFIILEDQVRIGDQARINGVSGTVEQINLRTIVLRDGEGAVQVFSNGAIITLANLSKQFSYAVVDVRIAYGENMDRVIGIIKETGASMEGEPRWSALLVGSLDVAGVESLADGAVTIRMKFKTLPLNQGRVANELRRRLVSAFVAWGVKPFGR